MILDYYFDSFVCYDDLDKIGRKKWWRDAFLLDSRLASRNGDEKSAYAYHKKVFDLDYEIEKLEGEDEIRNR